MLTVSIAVIGPGVVGSALVRQIFLQTDNLCQILRSKVKLVSLANSKTMHHDQNGISSATWREDLTQKGVPVDLEVLGKQLQEGNQHGCCIVVDCTAHEAAPDLYTRFAKRGIHVVTPNKKFGAGPLERIRAFRAAAQESGSQFFGEATVGAGLPVMSTLRSLIETGDKVIRVQGILSGTLSYIFNTYNTGAAFSDVVTSAKEKGFTEPDPREDLSGLDVSRKVVILARQCGLETDLSQLKVESLVPEQLASSQTSVEEFMQKLPEYDEQMAQRATVAESQGEVIRYVGSVDLENRTCSVQLVSVPREHPFAQLSGTDNLITFTTQRYPSKTPLVVRGPGAGAEVTAAGIFSDIIQVIRTHRNY
ncbi:hypothetical protein CEUSTIGMA_g4550.t1 [Chlamydomonas eustigma]|uniref:Homoserine dehydrogenase n=1 Tax=Chlamydomonas eustigma TaxID=1157962 RepID=A0A250X1X9_9CHLO|nr:hypothetical protein CEUSTIGMA_g4550.t1 [Chlamydomonas eustigma]|eukprot:GAX77104.1 hypothetical protein CEUSTIGMA_g4550.t1 [Chlamydomonas eustigma]